MTTSQIIALIAEMTIVFITAFGLGYMTGVVKERIRKDGIDN